MRVKVEPAAIKRTKWHEYLIRFVFGGLITAATGWVAHRFGPVVGGLFLAFPAIFPASVTLLEKHEKEKQEERGADGTQESIGASGVESAGAAMGSIGLLAFGGVVWGLAPRLSTWALLLLATAIWLAVSVAVWLVWRKAWHRILRSRRGPMRGDHTLATTYHR